MATKTPLTCEVCGALATGATGGFVHCDDHRPAGAGGGEVQVHPLIAAMKDQKRTRMLQGGVACLELIMKNVESNRKVINEAEDRIVTLNDLERRLLLAFTDGDADGARAVMSELKQVNIVPLGRKKGEPEDEFEEVVEADNPLFVGRRRG